MSNDLRKLFEEKKALLNGHFLLSSGLHSDTYFQSALILQYPDTAEKLAQELRKLISGKLGADAIDLVISPAMGGIVIGQEVGRALGRRAM